MLLEDKILRVSHFSLGKENDNTKRPIFLRKLRISTLANDQLTSVNRIIAPDYQLNIEHKRTMFVK